MSAPGSLSVAVYSATYVRLLRGAYGDLLTADVRVLLATSGYEPADTDEWVDTPIGAEAVGAGYTQGGMPLLNRTVDLSAGVPPAVLTADPILLPAAGWTARYAVVYVNDPAGTLASPLLSWVDFGTDVAPAGEDFTITFSAGVCRIGPLP